MNQVRYVKLGDLASFINGFPFKPDDWGTEGLPIIRIQNLTGSSEEINYYAGEYPQKVEVNNGDILISWSASLGVFVWNKGKAVLNQHIFRVVFDKMPVEPDYFYYAVQYNLINMELRAHGATMKHIVKKEFDNTPIKYSSLEEQKSIAIILKRIDEFVERRTFQLELMDRLIKSRFIELFGDPSSNPMGWQETTVGTECYYIKDGPHKSLPDVGEKGRYPFISTRNIVNGYIDFSTAKYISEQDYRESIKKCHPQKGDMLYSKGGTTGIAKLIDVDIEFANWVHVAVLKFDNSLNGVFFENMLNSDYCYDQSQKLTKGIANRDLVLSAMAQIKMYKPPLELQEQFAAFVAQTDKSKYPHNTAERKWNNLKTIITETTNANTKARNISWQSEQKNICEA